FVNTIDPASPITNYNKPVGITINGTAYSLSNSSTTLIDTVPITSYIGGNQESSGDSVWIKVTSSINVRGSSTQTGFSSIYWYLDNNPTNTPLYTRRTPSSNGANRANPNISGLNVTAPDNTIRAFFDDWWNDNTTNGMHLVNNSGG